MIILVFSLASCNKLRLDVISPNGKQTSTKTDYIGDVIVKKITIEGEGDRYCHFLVTTEDKNRNKIQFTTHDLVFNINDSIHIDVAKKLVRNIKNHSIIFLH